MELKKIYTGLNAQEVAENRKKYGENLLTPPAQTPLWKRFITKFKDPLIIILLVAGDPFYRPFHFMNTMDYTKEQKFFSSL